MELTDVCKGHGKKYSKNILQKKKCLNIIMYYIIYHINTHHIQFTHIKGIITIINKTRKNGKSLNSLKHTSPNSK